MIFLRMICVVRKNVVSQGIRQLVILLFLAILLPALPAAAGETRFRTFALIVDADTAPLAAWQVELTFDPAVVRIVGIEGGPSPWEEAPYYDPQGLDAGRMVLATFTLEPDPPSKVVRVARVHVQETGRKRSTLQANLLVAADPEGRRIGATVRLFPEEGEWP